MTSRQQAIDFCLTLLSTYEVSMGVVRTTYLIDADGIIEKVWKKAKPDTNAGEILEYITGEK